jgi:hypothetical protein
VNQVGLRFFRQSSLSLFSARTQELFLVLLQKWCNFIYAAACCFLASAKSAISVQLYGERYEPADGESLAKLFLEIERDVLVACDPANLGEAIALDLDGRFLGRLRAQKLITRGPVSHEDIRASMRIRRTARKAIADYVTGLSGIQARAGDRSEIAHLQDRAEMPREKQSPPSTLIRPQDLHTAAARPDFIDDIVRELTEGE